MHQPTRVPSPRGTRPAPSTPCTRGTVSELLHRHLLVTCLFLVALINACLGLWDQGLGASTVAGFVAAFSLLALDRWYWPVVVLVCLGAGVHALVGQVGAGTAALLLLVAVSARRGLFGSCAVLVTWYLPCAYAALGASGYSFLMTSIGIIAISVPLAAGFILRRTDHRLDRVEAAREDELRHQRLLIARELHDTVTRSTTHMVLLAQEAGSSPHLDPRTQATMDELTAIGRRTVTDLRTMLRLLHEGEPGTPQDPTGGNRDTDLAAALSDTARRLRARGLSVRTSVEGEPAHLDPALKNQLLRVVDECAANMIKYTPHGGVCSIQLEVTDTWVELLALSPMDAATPPRPDAALSSGYGLDSIRQGVEALGGYLEVRPSGAVWTLRTLLPRPGTGRRP